MARNPKLFIKGTLIEVTSRIQEGLPLVPNELTVLVLGSILARAQTQYPVRIVSYCFMQNHFHILLIVQNPEHVPSFICYLKRESAHIINRFLGRRQHSVWCEGFDNPVILDPETAIRRLSYIYLNPVTAGLVPKIQDWCLSSASWVDFSSEISAREYKTIPRDEIPMLPDSPLSCEDIRLICSHLEELTGETYKLTIEPHAWKECFQDTETRPYRELHGLVLSKIRKEEEKFENQRLRENTNCPSSSVLACQKIRKPHKPQKFAPRMLCLAAEKTTRIIYLEWIKNLYKTLPAKLKQKGVSFKKTLHYPPGFFAPGGFLSASIVPEQTPLPYIA